MGKIHEIARNTSNVDAVMRCIETGTSVDDQDNMGKSALHYAARNGNYVVAEALVKANANLELVEKKGQTPLYHAVVGEHGDIVQLLLDAGVNPSHVTSAGYTALHYSARNGLTGILKQLLTAGAEHTAVTSEGHTPLALARDNDQKTAVAILEAFEETGTFDPSVDPALDGVSEEEAALMAELDAMEVKPKPISAGPIVKNKKMVADKSEDTEDGFGKVYVGKAPPPQMMKHITGGKKMTFDPSTAPPTAKGKTTSPAKQAPPQTASGETKSPKRAPAVANPKPDVEPVSTKEEIVYSSSPTLDTEEAPSDPVYSVVDKKSGLKPHVPRTGTKSLMIGADESTPGSSGGGGPMWMDNLGSVVQKPQPRAKPPTVSHDDDLDDYDNADAAIHAPAEDPGYAVPDEGRDNNDYAEVGDVIAPPPVPTSARPTEKVAANTGTSLVEFFSSISLPDTCLALCEDAGIDVPEDFTMFTEKELVSDHGFKVGHARKILRTLGQ
eukprot:m.108340 g.108340  ORF g.108340 m.108340 type:complete len:498 (+) comp12800_c1_seq1:149-1642(+)